ncbi:DNA polymerase sigma domain-containing protein [Histoplasma capsulatum]|uniref:DNA polymerase sigma domain-containing protein n=1 Tax=Ajellomyces capsulatus TaxID=5037 RepID=A0A8A1M368_AJECA|nr:DNA polymerase sigma domain-containing protein [Histoplasma capsulatum]
MDIFLRARRQYRSVSDRWRPGNQIEVVPDSLEETIQKHRSANRQTFTIRKIPARKHDNEREFVRPRSIPTRQKSNAHLSVPAVALSGPPTDRVRLSQILNSDEGTNNRFDLHSFQARRNPAVDPTRANISWAKNAPYGPSTELPWLSYAEMSDGGGMALPHSSVDLFVSIKDLERAEGGRGPSATRPKMVQARLKRLREIASTLKDSRSLSNVMLKRDRDPTLAALHDATGLQVQFQCGPSPPASIDFILNYRAEFPTLRALFMVLRILLETRGLFGGVDGGVRPYLLIMMIVAALKIREGKYQRDNVGSQLLHVLEFYKDTAFTKYGVSVEPPGLFDKEVGVSVKKNGKLIPHPYLRGQRSISKRSSSSPCEGMLSLQDPSDFMNDVGSTCLVMSQVKQLFKATYDDLKARIKTEGKQGTAYNHQQQQQQEQQQQQWQRQRQVNVVENNVNKVGGSMLSVALGANYHNFERFRDRLLDVASPTGPVRTGEMDHNFELLPLPLGEVRTHMESWPAEENKEKCVPPG